MISMVERKYQIPSWIHQRVEVPNKFSQQRPCSKFSEPRKNLTANKFQQQSIHKQNLHTMQLIHPPWNEEIPTRMLILCSLTFKDHFPSGTSPRRIGLHFLVHRPFGTATRRVAWEWRRPALAPGWPGTTADCPRPCTASHSLADAEAQNYFTKSHWYPMIKY